MFKSTTDQTLIATRAVKLNEFLSRKQPKVQPTQIDPERENHIQPITAQINENKSAIIKIFEKDNFVHMAKTLCTDNQILDKQLVSVVVDNIQTNIQGESQLDSSKTIPNFPSKSTVAAQQKGTVYERLFNDAERQRSRHQKRVKDFEVDQKGVEVSRNLASGSWDKMYRKGQQKEQEKKWIQEEFLRIQEDKKMEECTYKPQINELSKKLIKIRPQDLPQHLIDQGKIIKQKREGKETTLQSQERYCTFHPEINQISAIIMDEKRQTDAQNKVFENLHSQFKTQEEKQKVRTAQHFSEKYPFQPQIDEISQKMVQGTTFEERQQQFLGKQGLFRRSTELIKSIEPNSFRPVINRQTQIDTQTQVFENLYQKGKLQDQTKQLQQEKVIELQIQRSQTKAISLSTKIVDTTRLQSLAQLFDSLDSDGDGKITDYRINKEFLDVKRLQALLPLFEDIRLNKRELNKQQFIEDCLNLLKKLSIQGKHDLIFGEGKKPIPINYSFHPSLNQRSMQMAKSTVNQK